MAYNRLDIEQTFSNEEQFHVLILHNKKVSLNFPDDAS